MQGPKQRATQRRSKTSLSRLSTWLLAALLALGSFGLLAGCHAEPDDIAGQAGELSDPVRRESAIANLQRLYTSALERANGDRSAAGPQEVVNLSIDALNQCYLDNHAVDVQRSSMIIDLLFEMQDVRALPALLEALNWRMEVSEDPAQVAARTIRRMTLDEGQKGQVIEALGAALGRVSGARGVDNRMRVEFIRTLGAMRDFRTTPILSEVVLRQSENQNFLINRLAGEQLGLTGDPAAVPTLIKTLFIFDPNNPGMRMNDVGAQGLVRIGRPALQPLLDTLAGNNADAMQIATAYVAAVRQRDASAAQMMTAASVVAGEASYALGQLGFRDAIDPLIAETQRLGEGERPDSIEEDPIDEARMASGALALVSINREESDTPRIREALINVYNRTNPRMRMGRPSRPQLLVAMQHFQDPGLIPFLTERARRPARPQDDDPNVRVFAYRSAAFLANASEAAVLRQILDTEPEGDSRDGFAEISSIFDAITACDEDLSCWITKLSDDNGVTARKACYMVARYGRGNQQALDALVAQLTNRDFETRGEVLYALDFVATAGSQAAVDRIESQRESEAGTQIWQRTESLALAIQARLASRTAH